MALKYDWNFDAILSTETRWIKGFCSLRPIFSSTLWRKLYFFSFEMKLHFNFVVSFVKHFRGGHQPHIAAYGRKFLNDIPLFIFIFHCAHVFIGLRNKKKTTIEEQWMRKMGKMHMFTIRLPYSLADYILATHVWVIFSMHSICKQLYQIALFLDALQKLCPFKRVVCVASVN